jgi:hypothetical protein
VDHNLRMKFSPTRRERRGGKVRNKNAAPVLQHWALFLLSAGHHLAIKHKFGTGTLLGKAQKDESVLRSHFLIHTLNKERRSVGARYIEMRVL